MGSLFPMKAVLNLVLGAALILPGGCIQRTIGANDFFLPHEPDFVAETEDELHLMGERVFEEAADFTLSFTILNETGEFSRRKEDFVPADVEHGFLDYNAAGERLAWTLISREAQAGQDRPLVVVCGGNLFSRYEAGVAYALTVIGHGDVLLFDYPGTGDTGGKATPENFEAAADRVRRHAEEIAGGDRSLVFWGHSLGGFVCSEMARASPQASGMIIEASARNARSVAKAWKPWYLPFVGIRVDEALARFDTVEALSDFDAPILILSGSRDTILPERLSREVYDGLKAAQRDVAIETFPAGHTTLAMADGFDAVLDAFFERIG